MITQPDKKPATHKKAATHKFWVVVGFLLALCGQLLIRESREISLFQPLAGIFIKWDGQFHLGFKNPVNVLGGLILVATSSLIHGWASRLPDTPGSAPLSIDLPAWKKLLPWIVLYTLAMVPLATHRYSSLLFWAWLAGILFFTILLWKDERPQPKLDIPPTSLDGIWMLALFALAIASTTYLLNDLPAGVIADEGPFWAMAKSIALGETSPPFFNLGVFTFPVASSILQGGIMRWAGVNVWGWRFASALPAALTTIPLYLLARELFERRVAIAACVMMIVNPYFLLFARLGYNNSQALFPVTLCIYFLALGIRKNRRLHYWLAGLAAGLGFYTYFAAWLGLIMAVIILSLPLLRGKEFRKNITRPAIFMAAALVVMLPRFLYGVSGDTPVSLHEKIWETGLINTYYGQMVFGEEQMAQTKTFTIGKVEAFYDPRLYGILLIRGMVRTLAVLFDPLGYDDHQIVYGLAGPGSSIFLVLGLGLAAVNVRRLPALILSTWLLAGLFFLGALAAIPPRPTHLIAILPAISLISSIGLLSFIDSLATSLKTAVTITVLLLITATGFLQFFILAPYAYFPPDKNNYISWLGRQIPPSANLILLNHKPAADDPFDEELTSPVQHPFTTKTRADIESNPDQMGTWKEFAVYIPVEDGGEFAEWIAGKIPASTMQAAYAPGQRLLGYVVTDLSVNAAIDIGTAHGSRDLWSSPTHHILIACGLGIGALFLKQKTVKGQTSNKMSELQ